MGCGCTPGTPPPAYYEQGQWRAPGFSNLVTITDDFAAGDEDTGVDAVGTTIYKVTLPPDPRQGQRFLVGAFGADVHVFVPVANAATQSIFGQAGGPPPFVTVAQGQVQIFQASVNRFTGLIVWYKVI